MNITPTLVSINNGPPIPATLTVEQEQIKVESLTATKPDLTWQIIDQAGHFHAYDRDGELPTLIERVEHVPCPGGCDDSGCEGFTVAHYHCLICDEEVQPGRVPDPVAWIAGPQSWTVEVDAPVTDERVSVRVTSGAPLDDAEAFGVAARGQVVMEGDASGMQVRTTLFGVTALGYRRQTRAKQAAA